MHFVLVSCLIKIVNKSTKAIQEAHSENKNEQVAEPELDSVIEYGTGAEFMSMEEIFGVAYFDRAYLKEMPCYDNVVLIDVDQASFSGRLN
jgi:hypothetical protein